MKLLRQLKKLIELALLKLVFPSRDSKTVLNLVEHDYPHDWTPPRVEAFIKLLNKSGLRKLDTADFVRMGDILPTIIGAHPLEADKPYFQFRFFGQDGEDLLLSQMLDVKQGGTYVDVGAHHPFRFSNTYYFYRRGWRGINIDPLPGFKQGFDQVRPEDVNLEMGVSSTNGELELFVFDDQALNTFDSDRAAEIEAKGKYKLIEKRSVPIKTLAEILDQNWNKGKIDFLTIDVEKHELDVLKSNNWEKYRPQFVLVEISELDLDNLGSSEVHQFLAAQGYHLIAKTIRTCFYQLN